MSRRAAAAGTVTSWRPARATTPTWCTTARRPTPTAARSGSAEEGAVDGAEETDGIDLVAAPVGADYPAGLLVVQDGYNYDAAGARINQNFKLVSWADVLSNLP